MNVSTGHVDLSWLEWMLTISPTQIGQAQQKAFLTDHEDVDLCGGGAMVFGKQGRPLWRFSPPTDHAEIVRSSLRGFPLLHPAWMGRIEWFRHWRYDETTRLAEDPESLLRSYRNSRFAKIVLGCREEQVTLGGSQNCSTYNMSARSSVPLPGGDCESSLARQRGFLRIASRCLAVSRAWIIPPSKQLPRSLASGGISGRYSPAGMGGHAAKPSCPRHYYSKQDPGGGPDEDLTSAHDSSPPR